MTLASNALQKAIYDRLTDQITDTPVYDHVPQGSPMPFVRIGAITALNWDTKSDTGDELSVTIHAFDSAAGKKGVQTLLGQIKQALHRQEANLTLTGHALVTLEYTAADADVEPQGEVETDRYQHGVIRFRALVKNS
ncbi:DUF3168 domain-containing protein [Gemmata sp. G18]|uniref:DUF3168 domain-containing protein n=1 Tax=Gemmata palustris TaxID=2822762 RepID=A0ABS5BYL7_9BACT|nr:DUF3168 domain-containing protein [Gemmata palustris]MBP3958340.1 DUF3168 domain-containing protein [Gemmata palustris]